MEKKNKKGLVILGLLALCVILTAGIFAIGQNPKSVDSLQNTGDIVKDVTPGGINETPTDTAAVSVITPNVILPTEIPADSGTDNVIPLTVMPEKPEPPELPDTAYKGEPAEEATPEEVEAHEALDPALKNPDVAPNITPPPTPTARPQDNTPQGGSTNEKGEVYVSGFGWIAPSTPQGQQSGSDGDWDKQIGY